MAHVRNLSTQNETEDPVVRGQFGSLCRLLPSFLMQDLSYIWNLLTELDWLAVDAPRPVSLPTSSSSLPYNIAMEAHCFSLVFDVNAGDQNPGLNPCLASTLLKIAPSPPNEENLNHNSCQIFIMFNNTF